MTRVSVSARVARLDSTLALAVSRRVGIDSNSGILEFEPHRTGLWTAETRLGVTIDTKS